jgi:hypothetical protein
MTTRLLIIAVVASLASSGACSDDVDDGTSAAPAGSGASGGAAGTAGTAGMAGSGGVGGSPDCPPVAPDYGAECDAPAGVTCNYGCECIDDWYCFEGHWVQPPDCPPGQCGSGGSGGQGGAGSCLSCSEALAQGDEPLGPLCPGAARYYEALHQCICDGTCATVGTCPQWCIGGGGYCGGSCPECSQQALDCQRN